MERFSNRRMLSSPVVITWPASMLVTRVIGAKIWRRPNTSTTSPTTRGCETSADAGAQHHHDVADLADLVALGVEHRQPGEAGREDAGRCGAHGAEL